MTTFLLWVATFPLFATDAVVGGIIAGIVALLLWRVTSPRIASFLSIFCVVASVQVTNPYLNRLRNQNLVDEIVNHLKEMRLYAVLIEYHPEAERQLYDGLQKLLTTEPDNDVEAGSRDITSRIVGQYVQQDFPNASDEAIFNLVLNNLRVLKKLQNYPDDCVAYFNGTSYNISLLSDADIRGITDSKANLIESAALDPMPVQAISTDTLSTMLVKAYQTQDVPIMRLAELANPSKLPIAEQCGDEITLTTVLASLDQHTASVIYKKIELGGS